MTRIDLFPGWSTSSFGDSVAPTPRELRALGDHLMQCRTLSGRLFTLRCGAEAMNGFVTARVVTTGVLLALLMGAGWAAW